MKIKHLCVLLLLLLSFGWTQQTQNPDLKVNLNDYALGLGSGSYTCYDGIVRTGNQCLSQWLKTSVYVINQATSGFDCTTSYPSSWCILYSSSVPYQSAMYYIRDAVGASKYENAILHYDIDVGGLHASSLIGMNQFDWFDQIHGLTEGFSYYHPDQAQNGVLLYNGSTFVSDITGYAYGAAITSVGYNSGTFTLTGIASENFINIGAGSVITLTGFTSATFLNGKTATVISSTGTTTPIMTFALTCSANCTGSNETGYIAKAQFIPAGDTFYIGLMEPFDHVNVRLAVPQHGGSVTYQYSKGAGVWGDLTTALHWNDGTVGLTSGLNVAQISFYPPTDWASDTVHGTRAKFWIRIIPIGATTQPTIFNLRGDNLLSAYSSTAQCGTLVQQQTGTSCLLRGWSQAAWSASTACSGSPCTVAGTYEYNPNPPVASSARFIYQARTGLYGGYGNETWLNPSTLDNDGKTLAGKVLPALWTANKVVTGIAANGTMFDNAATTNYGYGAAWNAGNQTDLACSPSCVDTLATSNFESYWATAFAETSTNLHTTYSPFFVTGNVQIGHPTSTELNTNPFSTSGTMARVGSVFDLAWIEASGVATSQGYFNSYPQTAENQYTVASGFQVANGVSDHQFQFGFCDIISQTVPCLPTVWNRAIQGSMAALAGQYIFGNSDTDLTYTITSESSYTAGDQGYYSVDSGAFLTVPITSGLHATPFTFSVTMTTPLVAMLNNLGGLGTCVSPGCGTDNVYAGDIFVRICPTSTCETGDIFQVTTTAPYTVTPNSNVIQNGTSYVAVANNYIGNEKVQIVKYYHAALTPLAQVPAWNNMILYASLSPAFRFDIGIPDTVNGWQPPNGNCIYNVNHSTFTQPTTSCNHGDPDLFYGGSGSTAFRDSAQMWSGLPCVLGKYNSPHGTINMDCSPLMRRDYVTSSGQHAVVLLRSFRTGGTLQTAPEELITPSKPIALSNFEDACTPNCSYRQLLPDGTLGTSISSITIVGAGSAILIRNGGGGGTLVYNGPSSCPNGYQNSIYTGCFPSASGGQTPFTFTINSGSLCAGLNINSSTGAITGTPTIPGVCTFVVKVTDSTSPTPQTVLSPTYTPTIYYPVLSITTPPCQSGTINVLYVGCNQTYQGGNGNNAWSVNSGTLPSGLHMDSMTGAITGTPNASGTFPFQIKVMDNEIPPQTALENNSITINGSGGIIITTTTCPIGNQNSLYKCQMMATGGSPPYLWSVTSYNGGFVTCASGLTSINKTTGAFGGTPTIPKSCTIQVKVTDTVNNTALQIITILIQYPKLIITTNVCPTGFVGLPYNCQLQYQGGNGDNIWEVILGALPENLGLNVNTGIISGIPVIIGNSFSTIQMTDTEIPTQFYSIPLGIEIRMGILNNLFGPGIYGTGIILH
jgi:hypothetical protein